MGVYYIMCIRYITLLCNMTFMKLLCNICMYQMLILIHNIYTQFIPKQTANPMNCAYEGCLGQAKRQGLCNRHFEQSNLVAHNGKFNI